MPALIFSLLASISASSSNLFFKNAQLSESNPNGYLVFFYLTSLVLSLSFSFPIIEQGFSLMMLGFGAGVNS